MNPLDEFKQLYDMSLRENRAKKTRETDGAIAREGQQLDRHFAYETAQREAIDMRRITFEIASAASMLLAHQSPELEVIYQEPVMTERGLFKKRLVQTGTRPQVALEGWPLNLAEPGLPSIARPYTLVLTPYQNINDHPPLVWYDASRLVTKQAIHPLSRTPLSYDDVTWCDPRRTERRRSHQGSYDRERLDDDTPAVTVATITAEPDPQQEAQLQEILSHQRPVPGILGEALLQLTNGHRQEADYRHYKKATIEQKVRKAIAEIAAKYEVL